MSSAHLLLPNMVVTHYNTINEARQANGITNHISSRNVILAAESFVKCLIVSVITVG